MTDPNPARALAPRPQIDSLTPGTDILADFFQWDAAQGTPPQEAGHRCSRLAFFRELFLASFLARPGGPPPALDQLTAVILDRDRHREPRFLPPLQPGSSIMPGKVNPVLPELVGIVAYRVIGNDVAVGVYCTHGQLQLNAFEPLAGICVMESQQLLHHTALAFRTKCIDGITVNEKTLQHYMDTTVGIVTALNPVIGYEEATELAAEAYATGKGLLELVREKKILTEAQIADILDPAKLTGLDPAMYEK